MEIVFLGTRGGIAASARGHRMHTATLVCTERVRVLVDCGASWLGRVRALAPDAIVLTHAHPDHAAGLARGAPCEVHATRETWERLRRVPIPGSQRVVMAPRHPFRIAALRLEAFPVLHSQRAPAVGLRIRDARASIFYVPDVLEIADRPEALRDIALYVGDGASLVRPIVRRSRVTGERIGHASILEQLEWCRAEGVPRMIVTHCGTAIVAGDERAIAPRLRRMAEERGVELEIAHDGARCVVSERRAARPRTTATRGAAPSR